MPSKRGIEQALTWLRSKSHDPNTLDAINAELCINVITDLQRQYDRLGAQFNNIRNQRYENHDYAGKKAKASFMEEVTPILNAWGERTKNIPLNEKGDADNEKIRTETAVVCDRKSDH